MARRKSTSTEPEDSSAEIDELEVCVASKVKEQRQSWLIPNWIPNGCLAVLDGDKGAGKSYLAATLAAHVTGGPAFMGAKQGRPRGVIWGAAEESVHVETRPKLRAAGVDLSRVVFLGMNAKGGYSSNPTFPACLPALERLIHQVDAGLIFLDPLRSYLPVGLSPGDEKQNGTLATQMNRLAELTNSVLLCARHLTKVAARDAVHSGTGSVAWAAVARAVMLAEETPCEGFQRLLHSVRCNRTEPTPPRCYSIVEENGQVVVKWGPSLGEEQTKALSLGGDEGIKLESNVAEDLLRRELAKGARRANDLFDLAENDRISKLSLWRAAKKIGVLWKRKGFGSEGYVEWTLPGKSDTPHKRKNRSKRAK